MLTLIPNEHLSDGELIRFLDGEAEPAEREHADAHLASCAECRQRLDAWGGRSARLSGLLQMTDVPVPASAPPGISRQVPWLRAAAMVVVLIGAAALASPVRAWVTQWIRQWTEQAVPERRVVEDTRPASAPAPERSTRVQFTPSGDVLSLEFATHQNAGAVLLQTGSGSQASVEVLRGADEVDVLVLPAGIQIRNTAGSTAEYRVVVPGTVGGVRIRIGNDAPTRFSAEETRVGRRIDLRAGGR